MLVRYRGWISLHNDVELAERTELIHIVFLLEPEQLIQSGQIVHE